MNRSQKQISKEVKAIKKALKLNYREAKKEHKEQIKIMTILNPSLK